MGGWKESGLGSRHGPDGIRKYTKRQSLMVDPGLRAVARRRTTSPTAPQASQAMGEAFAALATSDLFNGAQRATLVALCDTFIPSLDPPEGEADPLGFWAPRRLARGRPRGGRGRAAAGRAAARADRRAARAARRARRERHGGRDPARAARADRARLLRPEPRGARRDHDPARSRRRRSSTRCPTSAPGATRPGTRSATRARSRRRPIARGRSRCTGPRAPRR